MGISGRQRDGALNLGNNNQNDFWLVKSSGRILGPYRTVEVIAHLASGELVLHDEVAKNGARWSYLRNEPLFSKVIEQLRVQAIENGEDTITATGYLNVSGAVVQEGTFSSVIVNEERPFDAESEGSDRAIKSYGVFGEEGARRKARQSTLWIWGVVTVIFLGLIVGGAYKYRFKKLTVSKNDDRFYIAEARRNLRQGNFEQSRFWYRKAYEFNPDNSAIYLQLGVLSIQQNGDTRLGKMLLKKLLIENPVHSKHINTGLGLAHLIDGDLSQSSEYFHKALEADPLFLPATSNLGVVGLSNRNFTNARLHFQSAIKSGSLDGLNVLGLAQANIQEWRQTGNDELLKTQDDVFSKYIKISMDYRQEVLLGQIYVKYLLGDSNSAYELITDFLDTDPSQTKYHLHDIMVFRNVVGWDILGNWCEDVVQNLPSSAKLKTLESVCLVRTGQRGKARRKIGSAVTMSPKDPLIQGVFSLILFELGQLEEGSMAVGKAVQYNKDKEFKLPLILQANFCHQMKNYKCADRQWKELLNLDAVSLGAIAGLAGSHLRKRNLDSLEQSLVRGVTLSDKYIPFIVLLDKLKKNRKEKSSLSSSSEASFENL